MTSSIDGFETPGSADRPADPAAKLAAALAQLARARRIHRQAAATKYRISPLQLDLLGILADGNPPEPTVGLLARELGVSQPTITDAVTALERKGFVRRERTVEMPRRTLVRLTAEGLTLAAPDDPIAVAAESLDAALRDAMLEGALRLIAQLAESRVITVARTCFTCRFHGSDDEGSRCELLNIRLEQADLRVNCPEHEPAA